MGKRKVITYEVNTLQMIELRARMTEGLFGSFVYSFVQESHLVFLEGRGELEFGLLMKKSKSSGFKSCKRKCRFMALVVKPVNTSGFEV